MNKLLFVIVFLSFSYVSKAQKYNELLLKSYSHQELISMDTENLKLLEFAINNACYLTPVPKNKSDRNLKEIDLKNQNNPIIFTDFGIKILDATQYFKVKNRNELLVVKSRFILGLELAKTKRN